MSRKSVLIIAKQYCRTIENELHVPKALNGLRCIDEMSFARSRNSKSKQTKKPITLLHCIRHRHRRSVIGEHCHHHHHRKYTQTCHSKNTLRKTIRFDRYSYGFTLNRYINLQYLDRMVKPDVSMNTLIK